MPSSKESSRGRISDRLQDWQKQILDQRLKDAEEHPEDWISWDEVRLRLERQIHGDEPKRMVSRPGLKSRATNDRRIRD